MRKLLCVIVLMLLISMFGCENRQEEIDAMQAALDAYAPYDALIASIEQGDFETADRLLDGYEQRSVNAEVLSGVRKQVDISSDNWNEYFEIRELTEWTVNDLGETTGFITHVCLCLKEDYAEQVVPDSTCVYFGWEALCSVKNCDVDTANRIVSVENVFSSGSTTFGAPEILSGTLSYNGEVFFDDFLKDSNAVCKIGEIVVIGEYRLDDAMKSVCFDYENVTITSAQGVLVLDMNGEGNE